MSKTGLVLTGGGARAAYQAGVLKAISEIWPSEKNPFQVISGTSAGALNGLWLGSQGADFAATTQSMWNTWADIEMHKIFKTDIFALLHISARWIKDLSLGGNFRKSNINYLLDTTPLRDFVRSSIDFKTLKNNIATKKLHAIAITATNYDSGSSVNFFDGHPSIALWSREWRESRRTNINLHHVLASMAIPIFFPPVKLEDGFYADGGIMQSSPLSPAIHMGADKILAIGVHHKQIHNKTIRRAAHRSISIGGIAGTLLNALFFHSIDDDLERLNRINRTVALLTEAQLAKDPDHLRYIPVLSIQPSRDLGKIATELFRGFPETIKYFLRGLGASDIEGWNLMSYLAFEKEYIKSLLQIGYEDAFAQKEEILRFFEGK